MVPELAFAVYVICILVYVSITYFDKSLESIQRYQGKLSDLEWNGDTKYLQAAITASAMFTDAAVIPSSPSSSMIVTFGGYGFTGNKYTKAGCVIMDRGGDAVVSFVSTASVSDVAFAASNTLKGDLLEKGKVHEGMFARASELMPSLTRALRYTMDRKRLVFTGHSLGGAMAIITALLLVEETGIVADEVVVFGCPAIGDSALRSYIDGTFPVSRCFVNTVDPTLKAPSKKYAVPPISTAVTATLETGNANVNHGVKTYRKLAMGATAVEKSTRPHRFDEILSRLIAAAILEGGSKRP